MNILYFVIYLSILFNFRVIVYRSQLPFIFLRFVCHWVVTFSMLLYLDWDTIRICLVGLRRSLLWALPDVAIFRIMSSCSCLASLMAILWSNFREKSGRRAVFPCMLNPCCVNVGVSLVFPLQCDHRIM